MPLGFADGDVLGIPLGTADGDGLGIPLDGCPLGAIELNQLGEFDDGSGPTDDTLFPFLKKSQVQTLTLPTAMGFQDPRYQLPDRYST